MGARRGGKAWGALSSSRGRAKICGRAGGVFLYELEIRGSGKLKKICLTTRFAYFTTEKPVLAVSIGMVFTQRIHSNGERSFLKLFNVKPPNG